MKKIIIAGAVIVLLLVAGGIILSRTSNKSTDSKAATSESDDSSRQTDTKSAAVKACDVITLEDAKSLIGANATLLPESSAPNLATTDSVTVDNCSYSADGATLGDMMQLTLQVQSGQTAAIRQAYDNYKKEYPGDPLTGLGDEAFYSTVNQQAVVRKGSTWFFVGAASMNTTKDQNKTQAIKAAETALKKL